MKIKNFYDQKRRDGQIVGKNIKRISKKLKNIKNLEYQKVYKDLK